MHLSHGSHGLQIRRDGPNANPAEGDLMHKLTPRQAAQRAGVSVSLIYLLCEQKRLAHYRIGAAGKRGRILIAVEELDRFIADCRQERHPLLGSGE
jgi:excisionase family DNA binding protein